MCQADNQSHPSKGELFGVHSVSCPIHPSPSVVELPLPMDSCRLTEVGYTQMVGTLGRKESTRLLGIRSFYSLSHVVLKCIEVGIDLAQY